MSSEGQSLKCHWKGFIQKGSVDVDMGKLELSPPILRVMMHVITITFKKALHCTHLVCILALTTCILSLSSTASPR